ncbi:UNVERIFIED_CONTAM: hypothetical protein DES50_102687 [Williamsia faeni]
MAASSQHTDPSTNGQAPPGPDDDGPGGAGPGGLFVDIGAVLRGDSAPRAVPTLLRRTDNRCLLYPGKTNLLFGDPETGKTWIALAAGAEVLMEGGRFVFVDMDHNGVEQTCERLRLMGVPAEMLADAGRFLYVEPLDSEYLIAVAGALPGWEPTLALYDSVGELLPMMGASTNSDDEVTNAFADVVHPVARSGAGVLMIDHLAKNAESRRMGPVGAHGKTRIYNGTMVRVFKVGQFTPGRGGVASLWVHKDRPGGVRRETVEPERNDDDDEIKRDNLRRWGVFEMTSTPVTERSQGQTVPVLDENGYPRETLRWQVLPPKGLHGRIEGVEMPDPRKGGRPRGNGIGDVGSDKYNTEVGRIITALCRLRREGRITAGTNKTAVREGGFITPLSKVPFTGAWERWVDSGKPDDPSKVAPLTPVDPYDNRFHPLTPVDP